MIDFDCEWIGDDDELRHQLTSGNVPCHLRPNDAAVLIMNALTESRWWPRHTVPKLTPS